MVDVAGLSRVLVAIGAASAQYELGELAALVLGQVRYDGGDAVGQERGEVFTPGLVDDFGGLFGSYSAGEVAPRFCPADHVRPPRHAGVSVGICTDPFAAVRLTRHQRVFHRWRGLDIQLAAPGPP